VSYESQTSFEERKSESKTNNTRTYSSPSGVSTSILNMINHMTEILEAIIDQIFSKVSSMPYILREFFYIIYTESKKRWGNN
jgi:hypothetical protein